MDYTVNRLPIDIGLDVNLYTEPKLDRVMCAEGFGGKYCDECAVGFTGENCDICAKNYYLEHCVGMCILFHEFGKELVFC